MRFTSLLRHKHRQLITLIIVLVVSALPGNALALETNLMISPEVTAAAEALMNTPLSLPASTRSAANSTYSTNTVVAQNSPVTPRVSQAAVQIAVVPKTISLESPLVLEGEASYYSRAGCLGCGPNRTMANGQPLNDSALTMAIGANLKHLVGHTAKVTNLNTNLSVTVNITDTGGFYQAKYGHRVADLTIATKQAIGMNGGVGQVRVEVY